MFMMYSYVCICCCVFDNDRCLYYTQSHTLTLMTVLVYSNMLPGSEVLQTIVEGVVQSPRFNRVHPIVFYQLEFP